MFIRYGKAMRNCRTRHCFTIVISGFLMLPSAAFAGDGFYAGSDNLPATIEAPLSNCPAYARPGRGADAEYVPDRTVSKSDVLPADILPQNRQAYPVVRFDLRPVRREKKRFIPSRINRGRLRAGEITAGEVSIDTQSGDVALDGKSLMPSNRRDGCYRRSRQ